MSPARDCGCNLRIYLVRGERTTTDDPRPAPRPLPGPSTWSSPNFSHKSATLLSTSALFQRRNRGPFTCDRYRRYSTIRTGGSQNRLLCTRLRTDIGYRYRDRHHARPLVNVILASEGGCRGPRRGTYTTHRAGTKRPKLTCTVIYQSRRRPYRPRVSPADLPAHTAGAIAISSELTNLKSALGPCRVASADPVGF